MAIDDEALGAVAGGIRYENFAKAFLADPRSVQDPALASLVVHAQLKNYSAIAVDLSSSVIRSRTWVVDLFNKY